MRGLGLTAVAPGLLALGKISSTQSGAGCERRNVAIHEVLTFAQADVRAEAHHQVGSTDLSKGLPDVIGMSSGNSGRGERELHLHHEHAGVFLEDQRALE